MEDIDLHDGIDGNKDVRGMRWGSNRQRNSNSTEVEVSIDMSPSRQSEASDEHEGKVS